MEEIKMPNMPDTMVWITKKGKVSTPCLLYYWSISCGYCKIYLKYLENWSKSFPELNIILVHLPTSDFALNKDEVLKVYNDLELSLPCVLDNNHDLKDIINPNSFTPQFYLFGKTKKMEVSGMGENIIDMIENKLMDWYG